MDKRETGFWIAMISIIGAVFVFGIIFISVDTGMGVRAVLGTVAYDDFLTCINFRYTRELDAYLILGTIIFYGGLALFIANLIHIYFKRSLRYVFLALAGTMGLEIAAVLLQTLRYANSSSLPGWYYGFVLAGFIVMMVLGIGAYVSTFVFGRKLIKKASD
ncbi:MAG: hypothetical protein IJU64_00725 [Bacilli bacterium]|nr:hypothetical protein [Bacilli bacterium]